MFSGMEQSPTLLFAALAVGVFGIVAFGVGRWLIRKEVEGASWPPYVIGASIITLCAAGYQTIGTVGFWAEFITIIVGLAWAAGGLMLLGHFLARLKDLLWPPQ